MFTGSSERLVHLLARDLPRELISGKCCSYPLPRLALVVAPFALWL